MKSSILFIFLIYSVLAYSQSPYIKKGSIGKNPPTKSNAFQNIPVSQWVGHKFIFIDVPKDSREFGYPFLNIAGDNLNHPDYENYVGKIIQVTSVTMQGGEYHVNFNVPGDELYIDATTMNHSVDGIALLADIENARKKWLNKTLKFNGTNLLTYNDETDETHDYKTKSGTLFKVVDIVAGDFTNMPIRFILQDSKGNIAFTDVSISDTNIEKNAKTYRFIKLFSE